MGLDLGGGFGGRRFGDGVFFVAGQMRQRGAGQCPAGPSAGAAGGGLRAGEAAGVVLKMYPWVADERRGCGMAQQPHERGVGWRPVAQHRLVTTQIGRPECAVEAEDGAGGKAALPEGMGVFEAVVIKLLTAHVLAMDVQRAPVQPGARRREVRAGRHGRREQGKEAGSRV